MKIETTLLVDADQKLYSCLLPEINDFNSKKRSRVELKKGKEGIRISIAAEDPVALKATVNSLLQLLIVYEKTGQDHGTQGRDKKEDRAAPKI